MSRHADNKNVNGTHVERIRAQKEGEESVVRERGRAKESEGKEKIVTLPS